MNENEETPQDDPTPESEAPSEPTKSAAPPDRLSIDPSSKYFDGDLLQRGIGIKYKGVERNNVVEYSISEGWIRVQAGKSVDRKGRPMTLKMNGPVEVWFKDTEAEASDPSEGSE